VAIAGAAVDQPLWGACVLGLLLVPLGTPIACYYYMFIAAVPLLAERRTEVAGVLLTLALAAGVVARMSHLDLANQFAAHSLLVLLAFGFVASAFFARRRPRPQQPHL